MHIIPHLVPRRSNKPVSAGKSCAAAVNVPPTNATHRLQSNGILALHGVAVSPPCHSTPAWHRSQSYSTSSCKSPLRDSQHKTYATSMLLPFPVLLSSHIQARKKFALLGLLALGIFITIIQVFRIRTVRNLSNYLDSSSLIMWSTVENNLGIIVASIPTLAPLFKYYTEKTQKSSSGNSHGLYAVKPRGSTRNGSFPLGSGVRRDTHIRGPSEGGSEEFILGDVGTITKSTEVTVSTSVKEEPKSTVGR
jgi:hypothetical protein